MNNLHNQDYKKWIGELKQKVYSTQIKASIAVNKTLIEFYFFIGKSISEKENIWGSKLLKQTSRDLITEFPDMKGFSVTNLKYCKNFYLFYSKPISQQLVTQIPWGHNILIFTKSKDINVLSYPPEMLCGY